MPDKSLKERLDQQKREVAQVFEQMLGIQEALDYLRRERLDDEAVAQLPPTLSSPSPLPSPLLPPSMPSMPAPSASDSAAAAE